MPCFSFLLMGPRALYCSLMNSVEKVAVVCLGLQITEQKR